MWSTCRLLHVHKPLIRFLGKRQPTSKHELPHSHPAAPQDIVSRFNDIFNKSPEPNPTSSHSTPKSTSSTSSGVTTFSEFWEAPSRLWAPSHAIDDVEIQAVLVSVSVSMSLLLPELGWIERELTERWSLPEIIVLQNFV